MFSKRFALSATFAAVMAAFATDVPLWAASPADAPAPTSASAASAPAVSAPVASAPGAKKESARRAEELVRSALLAEANGDPVERAQLLAEALAADPTSSAAQWATGRVLRHGRWLPVEEAEKSTAKDRVYQEYLKSRDEPPVGLRVEERVEREKELAAWCRRNKLAMEANWHWRHVLMDAPTDADAMRELKIHVRQRKILYPIEQLALIKNEEQRLMTGLDKWKSRLFEWRNKFTSEDPEQIAQAQAEIDAIDDPAVFRAFEMLLKQYSTEVNLFAIRRALAIRNYIKPDDKADNKSSVLNPSPEVLSSFNRPDFTKAMVHAVGRLTGPEVNQALVRHAIRSRWPETRSEAISQLAKRPLIDYMPYAFDILRTPIKEESELAWVWNVPHWHERLTQLQPNGAIAFHDVGVINRRNISVHKIETRHENVLAQIEKFNVTCKTEMQFARELFMANAHVDQGLEIEKWWQWWGKYNELDYELPDPEYYVNNYYDYHYLYRFQPNTLSCFAAPTPVATINGLKRIDQIQPGEVVLAQNPQTGEVVYKTVLATTIRPPTPLRRLTVEGETIAATRGHRFWRDGRGWQMAKELGVGNILHALRGPVEITEVTEASEEKAYNLVVDDFHTYFVGATRVLVHDNSAPDPVLGPTPGLGVEDAAEAPSADD